MRFKLEVDMNNDAMQNGMDVASALTEVADKIRHYHSPSEMKGIGGYILDENGNKVGRWWTVR